MKENKKLSRNMQFNTTHHDATPPFDVFTIYAGGQSGAPNNPLPILLSGMSSSTVPLSSHATRSTVIGALMILLSVYLGAVRYLRYRHIETMQQKYGRTAAEFRKIDYRDAQAILGSLFLLDSPWIFLQAKDFAFLRVHIRPFSSSSFFPF